MEQQNSEQFQRQIAYKVPIISLLRNKYVEQEGWNPNYVEINGKQISRANIIATVIDKQFSETLATLTLDDSTGVIRARVFSEDTKKVEQITIGDPILIIGRIRKYNEDLFINIEIVRKLNPSWTKIRKIELEKEFSPELKNLGQLPTNQIPEKGQAITKPSEDIINVQKKQEGILNKSGNMIIDLIKELDSGAGADLNEVILKSNMKEEEVSETIKELVKLGEIYEPMPNKVKILG